MKAMHTRRMFLGSLAAVGAASALHGQTAPNPFRFSIINDEISDDLEHAAQVASHDFGLEWIELRSAGGKNISALSDTEAADARKILAEHKLRVTDLASPLFKVDFPGAPTSNSPERPHDEFHAHQDPAAQDMLLDRLIVLAKAFGTERIRCFDYWRLEDPKPYRAAINAKLRDAAERCRKAGIILMLENEQACNTATGPEAAATLAAVPNIYLNWDPANAASVGAKPFPDGYALLPKSRIMNVHAKDVKFGADGKPNWAPVGGGVVDWVGQLQALKRDGYRYGLSLETHWKSGGGPEASSRGSMAGLKKALGSAGITAPPTVA